MQRKKRKGLTNKRAGSAFRLPRGLKGYRNYRVPRLPRLRPQASPNVIVVSPHGFWITHMSAREIQMYRRAMRRVQDGQVARGVII